MHLNRAAVTSRPGISGTFASFPKGLFYRGDAEALRNRKAFVLREFLAPKFVSSQTSGRRGKFQIHFTSAPQRLRGEFAHVPVR
jgi:hypothetical protein